MENIASRHQVTAAEDFGDRNDNYKYTRIGQSTMALYCNLATQQANIGVSQI